MARKIITLPDEGGFYFARFDDFENIQYSPAGFGRTPAAARAKLAEAEREQRTIDARHAAKLHHAAG